MPLKFIKAYLVLGRLHGITASGYIAITHFTGTFSKVHAAMRTRRHISSNGKKPAAAYKIIILNGFTCRFFNEKSR
jgi:hypothetical protein